MSNSDDTAVSWRDLSYEELLSVWPDAPCEADSARSWRPEPGLELAPWQELGSSGIAPTPPDCGGAIEFVEVGPVAETDRVSGWRVPALASWPEARSAGASLDLAELQDRELRTLLETNSIPDGWAVDLGRTSTDIRVIAAAAARSADRVRTAFRFSGARVAERGGAETLACAWLIERSSEHLERSSEEIARRVDFEVQTGANTFFDIAKLRVIRRLAHELGLENVQVSVRPEVSSRSSFDPWTNALRDTASAFSAIVGGADRWIHGPYSLGGDRAARLGRSIGPILMLESRLREVADPAAGSALIESWTSAIATRVEELRGEIQAAGGTEAFESSGELDRRIDAERDRRTERFRRRRDVTVGGNDFVNPTVEALADAPAADSGSTFRPGAEFEQLRRTARTRSAAAFVAAIGPPAESAARRSFMERLLVVGGFAVETCIEELDRCVVEYESTGKGVGVVIACSDETLATSGLEIVERFRVAGAPWISVAGCRDDDLRSTFAEAGATSFFNAGDDAHAYLRSLDDRTSEGGARA